uniref:Uncharacterized protein n=1 Tax=Malurus cyaneus samueli TaxID=2593467 RepID=A0A8C5UBU1_9PASS
GIKQELGYQGVNGTRQYSMLARDRKAARGRRTETSPGADSVCVSGNPSSEKEREPPLTCAGIPPSGEIRNQACPAQMGTKGEGNRREMSQEPHGETPFLNVNASLENNQQCLMACASSRRGFFVV